MKLLLQCDGCGKKGTPEEINCGDGDVVQFDFCHLCSLKDRLKTQERSLTYTINERKNADPKSRYYHEQMNFTAAKIPEYEEAIKILKDEILQLESDMDAGVGVPV